MGNGLWSAHDLSAHDLSRGGLHLCSIGGGTFQDSWAPVVPPPGKAVEHFKIPELQWYPRLGRQWNISRLLSFSGTLAREGGGTKQGSSASEVPLFEETVEQFKAPELLWYPFPKGQGGTTWSENHQKFPQQKEEEL